MAPNRHATFLDNSRLSWPDVLISHLRLCVCHLPWFFFSVLPLYCYLPPPSCTHAWSCNPMDFSPPDSSVHGLFQASILEWVAISFSRYLDLECNRQSEHSVSHQHPVKLVKPHPAPHHSGLLSSPDRRALHGTLSVLCPTPPTLWIKSYHRAGTRGISAYNRCSAEVF